MKKGKKILLLIAALTMLGTSVVALVATPKTTVIAAASNDGWNDCYKGLHCGTQPKCGRYVDSNKDGYCDHGQVKPGTTNKVSSFSFNKKASSNNGCNGDCAACGACA